MDSNAQKTPISGVEVIADMDRFQNAMRAEMVGLPPSPAKEMLECAFAALGPLLAGLTRDYPIMLTAFQKQRGTIESKIQKANQNVAKAKENMATLPSVEQIQKNITPVAPTLPSGLSVRFADEMKSRYLAKPIVDVEVHGEPTAWHDWSMAR